MNAVGEVVAVLTLAIGAIRRASASCPAVTSDSPISRILPSSRSRTSAPTWSASGTSGSTRCSWNTTLAAEIG